MFFEVFNPTYHSPITIEIHIYRVLLGTLLAFVRTPVIHGLGETFSLKEYIALQIASGAMGMCLKTGVRRSRERAPLEALPARLRERRAVHRTHVGTKVRPRARSLWIERPKGF